MTTSGQLPYLIGCSDSALDEDRDASPQSVGFKAYNLMRMARIGLRVPPAFVLGTAWCQSEVVPDAVWQEALRRLELQSGRRFGDACRPLLLSVRSGAPVSMPGMMETLLNIGLCDATVSGFLRQTGNPRLVWDSYRRLVASHGEIVHGLPPSVFEQELQRVAQDHDERDLDFAQLRELTHRYLQVYLDLAGEPFPQDPVSQLRSAIHAVFRSWHGAKARAYRQAHEISDAVGTAVTVQSMVFGNAGGASGAGVGFTRNPISGESGLWVDFLFDAQGEDVVSGRRSAHGQDTLACVLPQVWDELIQAAQALERHLKDMQDIEFTVENGCLYMLQTRAGKRTPLAAARIALDLLAEGVILTDEAKRRTAEIQEADLCVAEQISPDGEPWSPVSIGGSANAGVVHGALAFDEAQARVLSESGHSVILVRQDAETQDSASLAWAVGLLTERGARTSHAAVVARQMGKLCITGCTNCHVDEAAGRLDLGGRTLGVGDIVTLDGNQGAIYIGAGQIRSRVDEDLLARLRSLRASSSAV